MRRSDLGQLALHGGSKPGRDVLAQRLLVLLDGVIFTLLGGVEYPRRAGAGERVFLAEPAPMQSCRSRSFLADLITVGCGQVLQLGVETSPLLAELAEHRGHLGAGILVQLLGTFGEPFLAVLEGLHQILGYSLIS